MKLNLFDRALLSVAVTFLGVMALRPIFSPEVAQAQEGHAHFYVEPGIKTILSPDRTKQVQGKIVVDLTNGNIWGFPTADDAPYPIDRTKPQPATSAPIYLGKFDLAATLKEQ
jgi:hypothetical protein